MEKLKPKLFSVMKTYTKEQFVKDVIAGIIVAIIADINTVFSGYVPKNNPFFINISCGLTTYINANATPPNRNDVR